MTLADVLANPRHPGRDVHLFLPSDAPWTRSTPALLVCFDEADEEPEDVEARTGFRYVLTLPDVAQISENARLQLGLPMPKELLRAFLHYFEHDAFIDFSAPPAG